jgi:hypothetical protein
MCVCFALWTDIKSGKYCRNASYSVISYFFACLRSAVRIPVLWCWLSFHFNINLTTRTLTWTVTSLIIMFILQFIISKHKIIFGNVCDWKKAMFVHTTYHLTLLTTWYNTSPFIENGKPSTGSFQASSCLYQARFFHVQFTFLPSCFLLGLLFDPDDWGQYFPPKHWTFTNYMA